MDWGGDGRLGLEKLRIVAENSDGSRFLSIFKIDCVFGIGKLLSNDETKLLSR